MQPPTVPDAGAGAAPVDPHRSCPDDACAAGTNVPAGGAAAAKPDIPPPITTAAGSIGTATGAHTVEAALRASEQRFRDFAAASSDWFWETNADLRFCWFSGATAALSGISPERMLGRTRRELGEGVGDEDTLDAHMAELRARRAFRNFRYRIRSDSGTVVWLSVSGLPVFDAGGTFQPKSGGSALAKLSYVLDSVRDGEACRSSPGSPYG